MENREEVVYAGFWVRVLASVIDGLILALPLSMIESLFGDGSTITLVLFFVSWWFYTSRMLSSSWKATIGKKIVAIEVLSENGESLTFRGASFRFLSSMISYVLIIPILMMLFTDKKQTLHDKIAKTIVLDSAEMSDGSTYSNIKFIRVIGYILLAILSAVQVYTMGMMIFFYLLISSSSSEGIHPSSTVILKDYNTTTTSDKNISVVEMSIKKEKESDSTEEQTIVQKTYSSEEKRFWSTAKNGNIYGVGYYEGKDLNIQNEKGQTPLMIAVSNGYDSVVQGFSEGILDISMKDHEGRTAYDYIKKPTNRNEELHSNRMKSALKMAEAAQIFKDKAYVSAMGYKNATGIITVRIRDADCSDFDLPKYIVCKD